MGNTSGQPEIKTVENYNIVKCMNVEPIENKKQYKHRINLNATKEKLFYTKCKHKYGRNEKCDCHILAYHENMKAEYETQPAFYEAFCYAYNKHCDIILSPDDIWMIICLQFTKYVNKNSEAMRKFFVQHEGKKKLTVITSNETDESKWEEFFELMLITIKNNTSEKLTDLLQANFSTTTTVEKLLSTAVIMDTLKTYFDYGRCIPCCGIRNLMFMGTLEDWILLQTKVSQLGEYAVDDSWRRYIDELNPIIVQFLEAYQGRVNQSFWDKIMNIRYGSLGSGSTSYVSGWILNFYGIYTEVESDEIKEDFIDVTVEIDNKLTGIKKDVNIVGGFTGIAKVEFEEYIGYRPQMSFMVYHNGDTK